MSLVLGLDIGAQSIKACLTDRKGSILYQCDRKTGPETSNEDFLTLLEDSVSEVFNFSKEPIQSIGIGSPGPIDKENGILISSANLPKLKDVPLVSHLKKKFNIPVYYDNDANCAALGEYWFGSGKNSPSLIVITLGTGLGGGWVFEGKLFDGYKGNSLEVGHTTIRPGGALCGCGQRGCIEAYFSASGFSARYLEKTGKILSDVEILFETAEQGDPSAKLIIEEGIEALAETIRNLIHLFNPECIVLSGGIARSYSRFGKRLENRVREIIFPIFKDYTRILAGGSVTGALGAASLCLDNKI
ncbi:ROK family protein [Leptospira langatensis]|uniref:ROK family protein n=1 Tax=Leptospira langatensis TaxID=2484983 RepID=A0A5F1ZV57_9LEPT|nr:ROK family protein [Leptospira langatensis]TGK00234.1 ROK family protein [Leptospira langatensis]TGL41132.1 ROK family protein [Leptospira langatensis]